MKEFGEDWGPVIRMCGVKNPHAVFSIRLNRDELEQVTRAADWEGQTVTGWLKMMAMREATRARFGCAV